MGILDSLLGRGEKRREEEKAPLPPQKRIKKLRSTPSRLLEDFESLKNGSLDFLKDLRSAEFKEEIHPRLRKMVDGSRNAFVAKMESHISGATARKNLADFRQELEDFLKESNKEMDRYANRIALGFERELEVFSSKMSQFNDLINRISRLIESRRPELESLQEVVELRRSFKQAKKEEASLKRKLKRSLKSLEVKKRQVKESKKELKSLDSSKKASKQEALEKDIDELRSERDSVEKELKVFRAGVEKGLRDYMRGIEKTSMYDSIEAFLQDIESVGDLKPLEKAVSDMVSLVEKGEIELRAKRKKKLMKAAETEFKALFKRLEEIDEEVEAKQEAIRSLGFTSMKEELRSRIRDLESDIDELEGLIPQLRKDLEKAEKTRLKLGNEVKKE